MLILRGLAFKTHLCFSAAAVAAFTFKLKHKIYIKCRYKLSNNDSPSLNFDIPFEDIFFVFPHYYFSKFLVKTPFYNWKKKFSLVAAVILWAHTIFLYPFHVHITRLCIISRAKIFIEKWYEFRWKILNRYLHYILYMFIIRLSHSLDFNMLCRQNMSEERRRMFTFHTYVHNYYLTYK